MTVSLIVDKAVYPAFCQDHDSRGHGLSVGRTIDQSYRAGKSYRGCYRGTPKPGDGSTSSAVTSDTEYSDFHTRHPAHSLQ